MLRPSLLRLALVSSLLAPAAGTASDARLDRSPHEPVAEVHGPAGPLAQQGPELAPLSLEREVEQLALLEPARDGGFEVGAFVKVTGASSRVQNDDRGDGGWTDVSLDAARFVLDGDLQDVELHLALEGSHAAGRLGEGGFLVKSGRGGPLELLDAYVVLALPHPLELQVGQFRRPLLFTSMIETDALLFGERTLNALVWQERDQGAMLHGLHGRLEWWLAGQNGLDDAGSDSAWTGRVALRVFGEGESPRHEGAFDADLGQTLYVAGSLHADGSDWGDAALAGEGYYTYERFSLGGELVQYGGAFQEQVFWSLSGACMLEPDRWELAARFEDFDERAGHLVKLGLNRYLLGYSLRWQAEVARFEHDGGGSDVNLFELGLVVSL